MKKELLQLAKGIMVGVLLVAGVSLVNAAWTGPTGTAPAGNVAAPINVSATAQSKEGYLTIGQTTAGNATSLGGGSIQNSALYIKSPAGQYDIAADIDGTLFSKGIFNTGGFLNKGSVQINDATGAPQFIIGSQLTGSSQMGHGLDPIQALVNFDAMKDLHVVGNTYVDNIFTAHQSIVSPAAQLGSGTAASFTVGPSSSTQLHNLELTGTTNIGQGGSCNLASSSDMTQGCPMGAYLYQVDAGATSGKCRYFDPKVVISSGSPNCYAQPALAVNISGTETDKSCNLTTWQFTAAATGGVGGLTYSWSTAAGPLYSSGGGTSKTYSFMNSGGAAVIEVTVTDSKGNTASTSKNFEFGSQPTSVNGVQCVIF